MRLRVLGAQVLFEQRAFWRNPASAVFTFVLPIVILITLGSALSHTTFSFGGKNYSYDDYIAPAMTVFGITAASFTSLAMILTIRRDNGILKRFRGSPVPARTLVSALLISTLINVLVMIVLTLGIGIVLLGVKVPADLFLTIGLMLFGAGCFALLGIAMSTLVPSADSAPAVVNGVFIPLSFFSGIFFPVAAHSWIGTVGAIFPLSHFATAVFDAFNPVGSAPAVSVSDIVVIGAWGAAGLIVALLRFRWESSKK